MPTILELLDKAASDLRRSQAENERLKLEQRERSTIEIRPTLKLMKHIGANIRRLRIAKGYSSSGLADLAGMAKETHRSIEAGSTRPCWVTLDKIAAVLDVRLFEDIVNS